MDTSSSVLALRVLPHGADLPAPAYASEGAAGMDLRAAIHQPLSLAPGARTLVPTGIAIAIPRGYEGQVRPRSGWALREGLGCVNSPGTVDSDYRGELKVILINHGQAPIQIERGDRIAQIVFAPVARLRVRVVPELDDTARGSGGFGHTGTS